ncbi:MAG: hypothetical protein ACK2T6_05200 [Anaerolineae bacterium]
MPFDILPDRPREYITVLTANVVNGTHTPKIVRSSGSINDPRSRVTQEAVEGGEPFVIFLEGYGAGEAFNRIIAKGYMTGGWLDADVWEGQIDPSAIEEYKSE